MNEEPRYFNRELSWLEFNQRVLDEATNNSVPLLERLKFLAITSSNLDEFFMVRVGSLKLLAARGSTKRDPSGLAPEQQLEAINRRVHQMVDDQYRCFNDEIEPEMARCGIRRIGAEQLSQSQASDLEQILENEILSILTPMAVSSSTNFPLLSTQTLNVLVRLAPPVQEVAGSVGSNANSDSEKGPRFAVIPFGPASSRILTVASEHGYDFIMLEDVIGLFANRFFPGETVEECVAFRISRNADLSVRDDLVADLLAEMEEMLDARKHSSCVRLELDASASESVRAFLKEALAVGVEDVFDIPGPLDLSAFMSLSGLKGFDELRYEPWPPQPSPIVDRTDDIFEVISRKDVLLYHPYDSFEPVQRLVEQAADDHDVLAIKQILYRTSRNSPIVAALYRAAANGKNVTAIVELKARFDEARNIEWAKHLEQAGVQVIYGVKGLKTHAKVCVVVRREPHGIQRYVHFGTGNYNESTAKLYSDVSLLTSNEELGADAISFFNAITGYSQPQTFRKIEMAPTGLRDKLLEMIETETQRKRHGQRAHIVAKLNSLVDPQIIDALYEASQAGVKIKLNVRGICCLRPGIKGLSENIKVISIVDRFLEHARIFYFFHGGDERVFISSADWMPRNLDRRVELLVPVEDTAARHRLIESLDCYFQDCVKASKLLASGSYKRLEPKPTKKGVRSQQELWQWACDAVQQAEKSKRTEFEPHRAAAQET